MNDLAALHSWEHWSDFLFRLGAISTPAELQGFVTGLVAGNWNFDAEAWLKMCEEFMGLPEPLEEIESKEAVSAFYALTVNTLKDSDYGFRLILPDDEVTLSMRAEAIGQFAQSFLNGVGMADIAPEALDDEARDMLSTLAEIANIDSDIEASEENELLYAELVEFNKIAALYIHQLLSPAPAQPSEESAPSIH